MKRLVAQNWIHIPALYIPVLQTVLSAQDIVHIPTLCKHNLHIVYDHKTTVQSVYHTLGWSKRLRSIKATSKLDGKIFRQGSQAAIEIGCKN